MEIPQIKEQISASELEDLGKLIEHYMDWCYSGDYHEDSNNDWEVAIYEATINLFLGKDVWDKLNEEVFV